MFPALPTGMARTSGASPSSSTTSKAAVFWPSIRLGLTLLTRVTGWVSASCRTLCRASSKLPSMISTVAPNTWAWTSLPSAIFPAGTTTTVRSPKRAP